MQHLININIAVDVIKALSDKTLKGNIYLMDNSPFLSINQGTENLCTSCVPGQTIHWVVYPIDLQTPVVIKQISFHPEEGSPEANDSDPLKNNIHDDPELKIWTGILPPMRAGYKYKYQLVLQMGDGINSTMSIDTPSLTYTSLTQAEEENKKIKI